MYYKYLNEPNISRSMQSAFGGINKNARIGSNEFADMQNMSGDAYPLMMPRAKRVIAQKQLVITEEVTNDNGETETNETEKKLNGILGDVGFCAVWGTDLYYMGEKVDGLSLADSEKKMLAMGAYILIYPDATYYNTVTGEYGDVGENEKVNKRQYIACSGNFNISNSAKFACDIFTKWDKAIVKEVSFLFSPVLNFTRKGYNAWVIKDCPTEFSVSNTDYNEYSGSYAIIGRKDGYLYYCSKATVSRKKSNSYYTYTFEECEWTKIDVSSFKLSASEFAALGFTDADIDNIWCGNTKVQIEKDKDGDYLITNSNIADAIDLKRIMRYGTTGLSGSRKFDEIGTGLKERGTWRVRSVPMLDYMCVHENRLWGCRYGIQVNNDGEDETVNEIYCSALGDFKRWVFSGGTATSAGDPYAMSVGDYGAFTGCVSLRGQLLFFKDDLVYRVSGNKPSNFQIDKISENGLQKGCEKSLETIDGVLFYKSRNGVFAYDGSIPQKISDALGNYYYTDAVAGKHFSKYYITMVSGGKRVMYVYDKRTGVWYAEDSADVRFFAEYDGALYGGVGNDIVCLVGNVAEIFKDTEDENKVRWYAETGDIGLDSPYPKYYHRVLVRMEIDLGARVKVSIDTGESWMLAADFTSAKKQTVTLPVITPRCEHMRIRIDGEGMAKIYSIYYETETVEGN